MNLTLAKMLAEMVGEKMILRESKQFHHRSVKTVIDHPDDVNAEDWKIRNQPNNKQHSSMIRGFHLLSEAHYFEACRRPEIVDDIHLGFYDPEDGSTTGEFNIEWFQLTKNKVAPRLKVYDDATLAVITRDGWFLCPLQCFRGNRMAEGGPHYDIYFASGGDA